VHKDWKEAVKHWEAAAELKNVEAMYSLGLLYDHNDDTS
jgi:TPR repeat protein